MADGFPFPFSFTLENATGEEEINIMLLSQSETQDDE